jgi:hypothetical protein
VTQIVETYMLHSMALQKLAERVADVIGVEQYAHLIHADIIVVIASVRFSAERSIFVLLLFDR